jgi:hypothetical protein
MYPISQTADYFQLYVSKGSRKFVEGSTAGSISLIRIREGRMKAIDAFPKEKLGSRVDSKTSNCLLYSYKRGPVLVIGVVRSLHVSRYLEINGHSLREPLLHLRHHLSRMTIEKVKIADSVTVEERSRHMTMEFPIDIFVR